MFFPWHNHNKVIHRGTIYGLPVVFCSILAFGEGARAACPAAGTPLTAGAGTRTETGCTISTTGANQSGVSLSGGGTLTLSGSTITTTGNNAAGSEVSGSGSILNESNVTISTETGRGLTVGAGSVWNSTNLSITTNASQQNLVPLLTSLPEYPVLGSGDPLERDYSLDSALLDV